MLDEYRPSLVENRASIWLACDTRPENRIPSVGFTQLLEQLDSRADIRGRQFEDLCCWYLRNAPEYSFRHV